MMVWPKVTWPSPATAIRPRWRTQTTVVAWIAPAGWIRPGSSDIVALKRSASGRSGVRRIVHPHEVVPVAVGIALRRGEAAVAEQLLDQPQIGALAQHVGGEAVTERVRRHPLGDAGPPGQPPHAARGAARGGRA